MVTESNTEHSLTWTCPKCGEQLGELNAYCEYCWHRVHIRVFNPDRYFIREIRIYHLCEGEKAVTPQEELFAELFTKHINILHPWVKDMDLLEIRAYRERMSKIAFEGKAAVYAAEQAEKEILKQKRAAGKPTGFETSLNIDEASSDAINTIRERQRKLTKKEQIQAQLEKLGISSTDASKLMSAGAILGKVKDQASKEIMKGERLQSPFSSSEGFVIKPKPDDKETAKPVFNPFEKKKDDK